MRLVMRVLLIESLLSWVLLMAGWTRVAVQLRPLALGRLRAAVPWRPSWRVALGLLIALPLVAGWPVLLQPVLVSSTHGDWLNLAIPWWLLTGTMALFLLVAEVRATRPAAAQVTCHCGGCVASGR